MREKVILAWSGGKDSALALYDVLNSGSYDVLELLTTVAKDHDRISIHGVRRVFLSIIIPIKVFSFPGRSYFLRTYSIKFKNIAYTNID